MEKKDFVSFNKDYFQSQGFEKIKNRFYRKTEDFLCEISIIHSLYGASYYYDYDFYIGTFEKPYVIDRRNAETFPPCVGSRFYFRENSSYSCEYLNYNEQQLLTILNENMEKRILPPFQIGKQYFLDHFNTLYSTFQNKDTIIALLSK